MRFTPPDTHSNVAILVDGQVIPDVIECDTHHGFAIQLLRDDSGAPRIDADGLAVTRVLTGDVEIRQSPLRTAVADPRRQAKYIAKVVALHFGLAPEEIFRPSRLRHIARPRQVAMVLIGRLLGWSGPRIVRFFGLRDHTTYIHARRQVERLEAENPETALAIRRILLRLSAAPETGIPSERAA